MPGFFSVDDYKVKRVRGCASCALRRGTAAPFTSCPAPKGEGKLGILIMPEAILNDEEESLLSKALAESGVNLLRDCWILPSVLCETPDGRTPKKAEIETCARLVTQGVQRLKPKVILAMGFGSVANLLSGSYSRNLGTLAKWRGFQIPDQELGSTICPMASPRSLCHRAKAERAGARKDPVPAMVWRRDVAAGVQACRRGPPKALETLQAARARVVVILEPEHVVEALKGILKYRPPIMGVDYETTGLKPDAEGHQIFSCGLASPHRAIGFRVDTPEVKSLLEEFLVSDIKKAVWSLQFEQRWTKAMFGVWIKNVAWDGMLAAHILDCRPGITSLKFQTYAQQGIGDYESGVSQYLKGTGENGINNIHKAPLKDVLLYNGLDALFTVRGAILQKRMFPK